MLIEYRFAIIIIAVLLFIAAVGLCGWICESLRLEKLREENRRILHENKRLTGIIARKRRLESILTVEAYGKGDKND